MSDTIQQIKDKLSIVDVVSQYVKLDRAGSALRARCPFHSEKSPSFFVSTDRGTYHCFGCGVGGDIFSFVEAIEGLDFKGALKVLADKAGVELVYEKGSKVQKDERERLFELMEVATIFYTSRLDDAAKKYLKDRGMMDATIKEFRLGWAGNSWTECSDFLKSKKFTDKEILDAGIAKKNERGNLTDKFRNRIMFPIADSAGRIIAFSGRIFGADASPEAPKYLNSPETLLFYKSRILYGFDRAKLAIRKHNCAVLVEGQMDLLSSHQAGWGNTVAVSGTAFTQEHTSLIRRMTDNLVLALDADEAGIKAAGRAARVALKGGLNVKVAQLPSGLDPADLILKEGKEAWSASIRNAKDIITFLLDVLEQHMKSRDAFRRSVELAVLPFLTDVQSPIAREQYLKEIATRLGVSEAAVSEALAHVPRTEEDRVHAKSAPATVEKEKIIEDHKRARHAYALLLWQRSVPKTALDLTAFTTELRDVVGAEVFSMLESIPEAEQEILRFAAERFYGDRLDVQKEAKALLGQLQREKLARELTEATEGLKRAEKEGNEAEVARLMDVHKLLTVRIAQL